MSDSNIQVGDEVSWNRGGGHPTGKAAGIQKSGELEIESKGKRVHKNADEQNPALHVERSGDDVIMRASELNRLRGGGEGAAGETAAQGGGEGEAAGERATQGAPQGGVIREAVVQEGITTTAVETEAGVALAVEERPADEKLKRSGRRGGTARGKRATAETRKKQSEAGKKGAAARKAKAGERGQRKAAEEAAVGEKREREEVEAKEKGDNEGVITTEPEEAEKEAGKEVKKAKVAAELKELRRDNEALGLEVEAGTPQSGKEGGKRGKRGAKVQ